MCSVVVVDSIHISKLKENFIMKLSNLQILIVVLIFLAVQEKSFSLARRVKEVHAVAVTAKKEMAVEVDTDSVHFFTLQKERIPVDESYTGARKMRGDEAMKSKKARSKSGDEEEEEKSIDNLMAFSSDYHPPKPHPPKNN